MNSRMHSIGAVVLDQRNRGFGIGRIPGRQTRSHEAGAGLTLVFGFQFDEFSDFRIEVGERALEHLAITFGACGLQSVRRMGPRQLQPFAFGSVFELFPSQLRFGFPRLRLFRADLFLNRLAFPSTRHSAIIHFEG